MFNKELMGNNVKASQTNLETQQSYSQISLLNGSPYENTRISKK